MTHSTKEVLRSRKRAETDKQVGFIRKSLGIDSAVRKLKKKEGRKALDEVLTKGAKRYLMDVLEEERRTFLERNRYQHKEKSSSV